MGDPVVLQENSTVGVHVGPGVLHLACLLQDPGDHLVQLGYQLEHGIIRQVLEGKLALAGVPRVGLPQHGMSISWYHLPRLERLPREVLNLFLGRIHPKLHLDALQPSKHLLVRQTVQGAGQAIQARREGEVGVAQGAPDQVACMGADVPSFMIRMDGLIQAHEFPGLLVFVTHHARVIGCPVQGGIWSGAHRGLSAVVAPVDVSSDFRQLRNEVHGIFVHVFPVLGLVLTVQVRPRKTGAGLQGHDRSGKLRHGMCIPWESLQDGEDVMGNSAPLEEFLAEPIDLLFGGDFAGHEQPHESFRQRFSSFNGRREQFLTLWDAVPSESYPFVCIEERRLPQHAFDPPHPTEQHAERDVS
eukprot:scaffold1431_cov346-Pavlova_lutheri.AAC.33